MATRLLSVARPQLSNNSTTRVSTLDNHLLARYSQSRHQKNEPELPSFSFKDLGASPTIKAVVYTALGIYGTAETYFYGRWAYEKFRSRDEPRGDEHVLPADAPSTETPEPAGPKS